MSDVTRPDGLECDHCGGTAIEFHPPRWAGDFWNLSDGEGGKCGSCGFPGYVTVLDDPDDPLAEWVTNDYDEAVCERDECTDCPPVDLRSS